MAEGFRRTPETSGRQIASADGVARLVGRQTPSDCTQFSRSGSDRPDFRPNRTTTRPSSPSPTSSKIQQLLRKTRENLSTASAAEPKAEEPKDPPLVASREELSKAEPVVFRLLAKKKPASSIFIVVARESAQCGCGVFRQCRHWKQIESPPLYRTDADAGRNSASVQQQSAARPNGFAFGRDGNGIEASPDSFQ